MGRGGLRCQDVLPVRLAVWLVLLAIAAGCAFVRARGQRCQLCFREFGIYHRRHRGNGPRRRVTLCKKHRDEWDAKYSFQGDL